ncbi:MAG: sulfatase [Planctomycetota bacterium]
MPQPSPATAASRALACRLITGWLAVATSGAAACGAPPNVVLILADDLGWVDTGCYGSNFHKTPNIDRLRERSMKFTNAYSASPLCSPTRASVLTGLEPARIGITAPNCHIGRVNLKKQLAPGQRSQKVLVADSVSRFKTDFYTLAESFRDAGYATGHFGKWHLGPAPYSALQHGFQVDLPNHTTPGPGGVNGYFAPWSFWPGHGERGDHIEDRMAAESVKFLRDNQDRPFFLNYWAFSVHSPWMSKQEYVDEAEPRADPASPQRNPVYAGMVRSLDDAVGVLVDALEELGLSDNTIIIFASDNGAWHNTPRRTRSNAKHAGTPVSSNAPLRSGKASLYEGGTRTPLLVAWEGVVEQGATSDALWASTDFFPTLAEACGLPTDKAAPFDGVSQLAAWRGGASPREAVFCHFPHSGRTDIEGFVAGTSVRRGDWKLIRFFAVGEGGVDRLELYNLAVDIGESDNVASGHPALVAELNTMIDEFLARTEAVVPCLNPRYLNQNAPVGGWSAHGDADIERTGDGYLVRSVGVDPFITTSALPKDARGPFKLRAVMSSDASGYVQVYWAASGRAFASTRSVKAIISHTPTPTEWSVQLPPKRVRALRIDPARSEGEIVFRSIELIDVGGRVVRRWPAP